MHVIYLIITYNVNITNINYYKDVRYIIIAQKRARESYIGTVSTFY